ncbi:MAG: hypothetical protein AAF431_19165 [Pseudomonadota bacterium]
MSTLQYSNLVDNNWSVPRELYRSEEALTSPALGTDRVGNKLLIWTEQRHSKTVLKFMARPKDKPWQSPTLFTDSGHENYSPTILFDMHNRAWVFWASTRKNLSDIYLSIRTGQVWSKAEPIHDENEVPDITPTTDILENGDVRVTWTSYNMERGDYGLVERVYSIQNDEADELLLTDTLQFDLITLPDFLPTNSVSVIHFPANKMIQSRPVSGSL